MRSTHLLIVCAALAAGTAAADVTITSVSEKDGSVHSATYVAGGKVRSENFKGDAAYVLWRSGTNALTTVMPARKSYMVMDAAQAAAYAKQAADAMKEMEAQLASMPPQVRDMMKQQMPNMGTGRPLVQMKVTRTGRTMSKGGHTCSVVDVAITGMPMAGEMGQEHCVVDPAKLGIPDADMQTLRAMGEMAKQMTKDLGQVVGGLPDMMEMGGWPVWTRDKRTGEAWTLKAVTSGVSGVSFEVPAGYKQEQMPSMEGGMGGGRKRKG